MKTIHHTATLYYYDGPQVFEARDAIGGHYIAVMVEPDGGKEQFLVAGVGPGAVAPVPGRARLIFARCLSCAARQNGFLPRPVANWMRHWHFQPQNAPLAAFAHLPESGFLLHDRPTISETLREARARNNLVMEVAVEPPEAAAEHRIRMVTLAGLLTHLQTMVKHAYGMALRELSLDTRRSIDRSDAHLLDVVIPAAPGSFRIVLEAARLPDMLGQSEMARALERSDGLFEFVNDPQKTLTMVKSHRGHLAGAYLRMLRFLVQSRSGLRYSWAEPNFNEPRARSVTEAEAGPLVDMLSEVSNLGAETVTLVGALERADIDSPALGASPPRRVIILVKPRKAGQVLPG